MEPIAEFDDRKDILHVAFIASDSMFTGMRNYQ